MAKANSSLQNVVPGAQKQDEKKPEGTAAPAAQTHEPPAQEKPKDSGRDLTEAEMNEALMRREGSESTNTIAEAQKAERNNEIGNLAELVDGKIVGVVQRDGSGMLGLRVKTFLDEEVVVWFAKEPFDEEPGFAAVETQTR